jgi:dipeptidyl aminopeptidase/acylaminoacyl peptidase
MARAGALNNDFLRSLLSIPSIFAARISNGRDRLGIISNATGRFELYSLPLDGSRLIQVSHGQLERTPTRVMVWSTDDREIVLPRDHEGDELHDLYRFRVDSSEVEQLTDDRTCQRYPWEFSPDGRWLLFVSDKSVDGGARQLDFWRMPASGGTPQRLTHHAQPVYPFYSRNVSRPDGKKIAYGSSESDDLNDLGVYVADSDGSRSELVYSVRKGSRDIPVVWSPDGKTLAIFSDAFDRLRAGILNVETRVVRWMVPGECDEIPIDFAPDGRRLMVMRTMGLRNVLAVYDLATDSVQLSPFPMPFTGEAGFTSNEGWVLAMRNGTNRPNEIIHWNLQTDAIEPLWSPPIESATADSLAAGRIVRYPTYDGREIEALLLAPRGSENGPRLPAIVNVHGGPTWQWVDEFDPDVQFAVSRGFVVLRPNIRGSTGYGATFRDLNRMDLGGGDLKDLAAAGRYLTSLPNVDPARVGITGISYGGFMTYMAMTKQPEIWAAGCAEAGITDWLKGYDSQLPALQHYLRSLMGDPATNAELWADRSPVNFARQMKAPLLMIHGMHDPRCPIIHAHVFRDALLETGHVEGKDFEYLEFSDEGHTIFDIEQRIRSLVPMIEFFQRRLVPDRNPAASGHSG